MQTHLQNAVFGPHHFLIQAIASNKAHSNDLLGWFNAIAY